MGLARDGSIGVLSMRWRRVEIEGALYVEEFVGGALGPVLYGPVPDAATCTALIRERAIATKRHIDERRDELLARYPDSRRFDRAALEDEG